MGAVFTDQVIKEMCRETGEPGFHNYTTMQGYMLDSIRDLNIFSMPTWSVKLLPITSFNTYDWPKCCVKPILTVLARGNNRYLISVSDDIMNVTMPNQPAITPTVDPICDAMEVTGLIGQYGWDIWSWGLGERYGVETMLPPFGLVIHDKKNRQSYLKGFQVNTGDQIYLFFKDDGLDTCPEIIPAEVKEVTEFFILMKWFRVRNPNLSAGMDEKYKERLFRVQRLYSDGGEDEWIRSMNSNTMSAPKI